MKARCLVALALGVLALAPRVSSASGLGVEVWTDRGDDAVYQPGQALEVKARTSEDAYLLVYEIDAEGQVNLLYPYRGSTGFVEGRRTYPVPPERANVDLVVQGPVGQCYVVAIASRDPFGDMPWYLRPYDMQAEQVGYEGASDDEEGITAEGRIVGDPFVAMERIRRRVLNDPQNPDAFGTSYATYYVHNEVRYPRYLCYDCHRSGHWAWWPGFDPYYASCSVIDYRINWGWGWGPGYWFGCVPYYNFVVRYDCPPRYRHYYQNHDRFSSWDGWRRWNSMWGDRLVRFKSAPPAGYVGPSKFKERGTGQAPPGFIVSDVRSGRDGQRQPRGIGRNYDMRPRETMPRDGNVIGRQPDRQPAQRPPSRDRIGNPNDGRDPGRGGFRERGGRTMPRFEPPPGDRPTRDAPRYQRPRQEMPRYERPRQDAPRYAPPGEGRRQAPRYEKPRDDRPADKPRNDRPAERPRDQQRNDWGRGQRGKG
jgi:hypothetical protein